MTTVQVFTFNPFAENTYVVYDDTQQCIIVDPGCYTAAERQQLSQFIADQNLTPVGLLNTHCHLDHVFGNRYVAETYGLPLAIHPDETPVLEAVPQIAQMYGIPNIQQSPDPDPDHYLLPEAVYTFGDTQFQILFTPGHSPASVSLYCAEAGFILAGDVLFQGSIGRTDLPGGDYNTLMQSIDQHLLSLPDDTTVYAGHGPATSIGAERRSNPFILQYQSGH